jgi:hypothetical protein
MDPGEKKGWTQVVTPEYLDIHMAVIGQAESNAKIILKMFLEFPLPNDSKLLVAGCGTCQMFDYFEPQKIGKLQFVFSDINPFFLELVKKRLKKYSKIKYKLVVDNVESSRLKEKIDGILAVLLLEHIEWKKGIDSFVKLKPKKIYLIIQEQNDRKGFVTTKRKLRPSIEEFTKIANPKLVDKKELTNYLKTFNYNLSLCINNSVPDNKLMVGLVFEKQ